MPILTHIAQPNGLLIESTQGRLLLTPYTPRSIRIRATLGAGFDGQGSLSVIASPQPDVRFTVTEAADRLIFTTSEVMIEVDRQTAAFTYRDACGRLLTREPARGGKTLEPVEVVVSEFDDATATEIEDGADGARVSAHNVRQRVDRQAYHTKLEFEWAPDEALYGLGSHEEGVLNLRGHHQYLYQQNMKAVVPVLVSTRGYGILLDSYSLITFHDDAYGSYLWTDVDDQLDYYFIYGPEFDQIVHELRHLTGKAPMLPKWAFGYIQSKERYTCQEELLAIAREYRARELPLDGLVLDWKSWPGNLWGQKTLDPARFPDPKRMMQELHDLHVHLMVSIWPIMRPGGADWQEMREQGCLLGNQATYNAFSPQARTLYWKQANEGLFSHDIDAWWSDCTEPFEADWRGPVKPEPEERLRINTEEAKRYLDPEYINAYSLLHAQGIYEGQRAVTADKRVVNLTRSAYAGQQRYGTITWSGDVTATWETLRRQIAEGLNFCVTGLPYWTVDIGGFFVKSRPEFWFWRGDYEEGIEDLGYRELYVRWFQWATFLPIFRSHGTDTPREVWRFGEPGDSMHEALVRFLHLRYRLLPYIYSLAGRVTHEDDTILRLLAFDFRHDPATYDIRDQYMFGPAFLVAPVTQPMYYAAGSRPLAGVSKSRAVYLPAGCEWYDFWTDRRLAGGQTVLADAPLDIMPLYVRAGAIVPMGPPRQHVDDRPDAPVELHLYPGCNGSFQLYEDEGDGYNYEQGAFAVIPIEWHDASRRLLLGPRRGCYPGMPEKRVFEVILHDTDRVKGQPTVPGASKRVYYTGRPVVVELGC